MVTRRHLFSPPLLQDSQTTTRRRGISLSSGHILASIHMRYSLSAPFLMCDVTVLPINICTHLYPLGCFWITPRYGGRGIYTSVLARYLNSNAPVMSVAQAMAAVDEMAGYICIANHSQRTPMCMRSRSPVDYDYSLQAAVEVDHKKARRVFYVLTACSQNTISTTSHRLFCPVVKSRTPFRPDSSGTCMLYIHYL